MDTIDLVDIEEQYRGQDKKILEQILPPFVEVIMGQITWYGVLDEFLKKFESGAYEKKNPGVQIILNAISSRFVDRYDQNFYCATEFKTEEQRECFSDILFRTRGRSLELDYRTVLRYLTSYTGFSMKFNESEHVFDDFNFFVIEKLLKGWTKNSDDSNACLDCVDKIYCYLSALEEKQAKGLSSRKDVEKSRKFKRKIRSAIQERIIPKYWTGEELNKILRDKRLLCDELWGVIYRGQAKESMGHIKEIRKKYS